MEWRNDGMDKSKMWNHSVEMFRILDFDHSVFHDSVFRILLTTASVRTCEFGNVLMCKMRMSSVNYIHSLHI